MRGNIENSKYVIIHQWLADNFGKASLCENRDKNILSFACKGTSKVFQWAKKKDKEYTKNKNDYFQLCISCHRKYDITEKTWESRKKSISNNSDKGISDYFSNLGKKSWEARKKAILDERTKVVSE